MKKVPEEDLIRIAFGEASEEESRRLLEGSDPGSAMKLDLYRRLCADLRDLATEVPEPQLSQERLQEAILRAGLKRDRRAWSWSWAFAPVAALAIGVLFIARRPDLMEPAPPRPEPIQTRESTPSAIPETVAKQATPNPMASPSARNVAPAPAPVARRIVRLGGTTRTKSAPVVPGGPVLDRADFVATGRNLPDRASRGDAASRTASVAPAPPTVPGSAPSDGAMIVLIASETDAATGANLAIEVASTSNVVIGS